MMQQSQLQRHILRLRRVATLSTPCLLLGASQAHAYIGPGGGLSALGALLALVAALVIAFFGFVWYPLRRFRRKWKLRAAADQEALPEDPAAPAPVKSRE